MFLSFLRDLIIKEEIDEVDFAGFLRRGGMIFEETGDGNAETVLAGFGGDVEPKEISIARWVGGRETDDMMAFQRQEYHFVEVRQVPRRHPKRLRKAFRQNYA